MTIKRNIVVAGVLAAGLVGAGMSPSFAGDRAITLDAQRLDKTTAEFSQYRGYARGWYGGRGWRGGRGAAVAGAVGLGILGAAAVAANSGAYAEPGYYDAPAYGYPAYGYNAYPVYDEPAVVYQPRRYYRNDFDYGRGPWAQTYRGAPDPTRGGR